MPALFTRPCSPPNLWAAFTAVSQSLSCVTSCRTKVAVEPSSDASWRPSASSTSPMTTRAPSATNKRASAAPCPRAPPLMSMTFPLRRSILSSICLKNVGLSRMRIVRCSPRQGEPLQHPSIKRVLGAPQKPKLCPDGGFRTLCPQIPHVAKHLWHTAEACVTLGTDRPVLFQNVLLHRQGVQSTWETRPYTATSWPKVKGGEDE